jgi:hypothetical protein
MILDTIAFTVLASLIVILLISSLKLHLKNKKLSAQIIQIALDKAVISEKLKEELDKKDSTAIEQSEGFLKFISESRDWAFDYIEKVQEALNEFRNKVEPKLKYANTYGTLAGKTAHLSVIEEITLAYLDLKKIMPEDDPKQETTK